MGNLYLCPRPYGLFFISFYTKRVKIYEGNIPQTAEAVEGEENSQKRIILFARRI